MFDKILGVKEDKKIYREHKKKLKQLPKDYQFVFAKIEKYLFSYSGGNAMDILEIQYDLRELFEQAVSEGKDVLEVTGDDVASFADDLLENANTYLKNNSQKLNDQIHSEITK